MTACVRVQQNVIHAGCWAHARRKFFEAQKSSTKSRQRGGGPVGDRQALPVEGERSRAQGPRGVCRRTASAGRADPGGLPYLAATSSLPGAPETLLGKAIGYTLAQWPKLLRYLEHPAMTPDTNACENAIRPFVVGRNYAQFAIMLRSASRILPDEPLFLQPA